MGTRSPEQEGTDLIENNLCTTEDNATARLSLANGSSIAMAAMDPPSSFLIHLLRDVMQLGPIEGSVDRQIMLRADQCSGKLPGTAVATEKPDWAGSLMDNRLWAASFNEGVATISLSNEFSKEDPLYRLLLASLLLSLSAKGKEGLYIHGALAEKDGQGVIMAGTWGAGKSTASSRLPSSWRSLCDDKILVVRDKHGKYWAHPWPTWSRFLPGGTGGTWDSQRGLPLKAIFFLSQSYEDMVEPISSREGAYALIESSRQALMPMIRELGRDDRRTLCTQILESAYTLAMNVPCSILRLTLDGEFWIEMEKHLPYPLQI